MSKKNDFCERFFNSIKVEFGIDPDIQALTPEETVRNMESEELRRLLFLHFRGKASKEYLLQSYAPELAEYLWNLLEDARKNAEEKNRMRENLKKNGKDPQPEISRNLNHGSDPHH